MSEKHAQGKTRSTRGTEVYGGQSPDQPHSKGGIAAISEQLESLTQRINGTPRSGALAGLSRIVGGIVTRMIADRADRLREVNECIEWYEREKVKRLQELVELQDLAMQMTEFLVSSANEGDNAE